MLIQLRNASIALALATLVAGCGRETQAPVNPEFSSPSRLAAAAERDEWKYECRATVLSGYQWVYVGKVPHSQAARGTYFCYGYSGISNFCTEVRLGGVFGAVTPCNFFNVGRIAYTWNRW